MSIDTRPTDVLGTTDDLHSTDVLKGIDPLAGLDGHDELAHLDESRLQRDALTPAEAAPPALPLPGTGDYYVGKRFVGLVLVLGALAMMGPLTIDTYLPALPALAADLNATDAQVQLTLTAILAGMAVGQLAIGPLSDALGRRRPLLVGLTAHALASFICMNAPTIGVLTGGRVVQGFAGAAVAVTCQAMVRDLFHGARMAEVMSRMTLVMGIAPIVAPTLGSLVLSFGDWHAIFRVIAAGALLLLVLAWRKLPESLPQHRRQALTPAAVGRGYLAVLRDPMFLALAATAGMAFSALLAYVGGSSFVLQEHYGLSAGQFGIVFGINSIAITVFSQVNPTLVRKFGPVAVLRGAVLAMALSALALVVVARFELLGVVGFVSCIIALLTSVGLVLPNASVVALHPHGKTAGTAVAVLGATQFTLSAVMTPLVGAISDGTGTPIGIITAGCGLAAVILVFSVRRRLNAVEFS